MPAAPYLERVKSIINSRDPKDREMVRQAGEALLNTKLLSPGSVHNDATLSNLSVQYANEDYIGLQLMPMVKVDKPSNKYFIYGKRDRLAVPNDSVGARSVPNEINESRSTASYSCQPYALMNYIDERTLRAADAPLNEMVDLVASVNDVMALAEEIRIADIMSTAGNFPGQTAALAAADRWDSAGGGDPIKNIQDAVNNCWMGLGPSRLVGYCSVDVWTVLARHPKILDLFKYVGSGLATPKLIAPYFGLDDILVGKARKDSANAGQSASYARAWGKVFGVARVANGPSLRNASFGYTIRFGDKQTSQWFDPKVGVSGGYYAKVGLDEVHSIVASDAAYLTTTVIS